MRVFYTVFITVLTLVFFNTSRDLFADKLCADLMLDDYPVGQVYDVGMLTVEETSTDDKHITSKLNDIRAKESLVLHALDYAIEKSDSNNDISFSDFFSSNRHNRFFPTEVRHLMIRLLEGFDLRYNNVSEFSEFIASILNIIPNATIRDTLLGTMIDELVAFKHFNFDVNVFKHQHLTTIESSNTNQDIRLIAEDIRLRTFFKIIASIDTMSEPHNALDLDRLYEETKLLLSRLNIAHSRSQAFSTLPLFTKTVSVTSWLQTIIDNNFTYPPNSSTTTQDISQSVLEFIDQFTETAERYISLFQYGGSPLYSAYGDNKFYFTLAMDTDLHHNTWEDVLSMFAHTISIPYKIKMQNYSLEQDSLDNYLEVAHASKRARKLSRLSIDITKFYLKHDRLPEYRRDLSPESMLFITLMNCSEDYDLDELLQYFESTDIRSAIKQQVLG